MADCIRVIFRSVFETFLQSIYFILKLFLNRVDLTFFSRANVTFSCLSDSTHLTAFLKSEIEIIENLLGLSIINF